MKSLLLILLLAASALGQQPLHQPTPTMNESVAQLRKIVSQHEAKIKQSAYDLACAKEYAEHGNTPSERRLVVSVCGGDEAAIMTVSDAEDALKRRWDGLRVARKSLQIVIGNLPSHRNKQNHQLKRDRHNKAPAH